MTRDDDPEGPPTPRRQTVDWQRRTATAVIDLTLALESRDKAEQRRYESFEAAARHRHDELVGLILGTTDPNKKRRKDTPPEGTDKFKLPAGVEVQAPRETTRKVVEKIGKVLFYLALIGLTHAARCLAEHQDRASSAPTAAERAP